MGNRFVTNARPSALTLYLKLSLLLVLILAVEIRRQYIGSVVRLAMFCLWGVPITLYGTEPLLFQFAKLQTLELCVLIFLMQILELIEGRRESKL